MLVRTRASKKGTQLSKISQSPWRGCHPCESCHSRESLPRTLIRGGDPIRTPATTTTLGSRVRGNDDNSNETPAPRELASPPRRTALPFASCLTTNTQTGLCRQCASPGRSSSCRCLCVGSKARSHAVRRAGVPCPSVPRALPNQRRVPTIRAASAVATLACDSLSPSCHEYRPTPLRVQR